MSPSSYHPFESLITEFFPRCIHNAYVDKLFFFLVNLSVVSLIAGSQRQNLRGQRKGFFFFFLICLQQLLTRIISALLESSGFIEKAISTTVFVTRSSL